MEHVLAREIVVNKTVARVTGVVIFAVLTGLGAFVRIPLPFTPVPITLQTFFVLLSGLCLGARLGAVSQLGYLCIGVLGAPVFASGGSGMAYLLGPTGGYLVSFLIVPFFIGTFLKFTKGSLGRVFALLLVADATILLTGALWLKAYFGFAGNQLVWAAVAPFIPGDILKVSAALSLYAGLRLRIKEIF